MKLNKLSLLGLSLITMLFSNCTKSEDTELLEKKATILETNAKFDLGKTVGRAFKGIVVDQNNNPLANVSVKLNGKTATTDTSGVFTLSNVSVLERFAYVTTEKAGFLNGSRTLMTHEGLNSLKIMMLPETVVATIPSGATKIVALPNGVKVTFDGAFMNESGTAYNGNVKVIMNHLDSADKNVFDKMPGTLLALNTAGEYKGLETYGMINVELRGTNNEKLQLTSGHKAQVVLPIAPNQLDTAPAKIQLWHFDEVVGIWKEDGFSTRIGSVYKGEVSHFSWWNNDDAFVVATLNVTVMNDDGTPVNNVRITINRFAGSTGDVLMDLGVTNSNGMLSSPIPLNEQLVFKAYDPTTGSLLETRILAASNAMVRNEVVVIGSINRPGRN
jgi:hypothetical protein